MNNQPHDLAPCDLLLLQKHIQLGKKHLTNCLTQSEIDLIFQFVKLPPKTEKELSVTAGEMAGQASLVVNTALTGILGFGLGLSALLKWNLTYKPPIVATLLISLLVGGLLGLQAIRFRRRTTAEILDKRKLKEVEIIILKKVNENRSEELNRKKEELITLLKNQQAPFSAAELEDPQTDYLKLCRNWLASSPDEKYDLETKKFKKIVQKLSHSSIYSEVTLSSWVQANLRRLIIELIPTLLGSTSSLFVYIGGVRTLAHEMGSDGWISFLERPEIKAAELVLMVLIVFYFLLSYLYMNRKAFKRDKELAKIETHFVREERRMNALDDQLLKMKEALAIMQPSHQK